MAVKKAKAAKPKVAEPAAELDGLKEHKNDTGSPAVQIGNLTNRITALTKHAQKHEKDHSSRRGLLQLVGKRRKLLDYLAKRDFTKYRLVIKKLGLRK